MWRQIQEFVQYMLVFAVLLCPMKEVFAFLGRRKCAGGGRALVIAHHPFLGHLKTGHKIYPFISALFTRPFMNISAPTCLRSPKMWNFINILKRKGLGMWVKEPIGLAISVYM